MATENDRKPWCCHPDCKRDAGLRLRDTSDGIPYDQRETDACVEHAEYLGMGSADVIVVGLLHGFLKLIAAATKLTLSDETLGLFEQAGRPRGWRLRCRCGAGPHPAEAPDAGLYIGEGGSVERICGACWQMAALAAPSAKALDEARKYGITTDMEPR